VTTLAEIEAAADALPAEEQWELFGFLKARLLAGKNGPIPEPRRFTREQVAAWTARDEEEMRKLREEEAAAAREGSGE